MITCAPSALHITPLAVIIFLLLGEKVRYPLCPWLDFLRRTAFDSHVLVACCTSRFFPLVAAGLDGDTVLFRGDDNLVCFLAGDASASSS